LHVGAVVEEPFQSGWAQVHVKNVWKIFFIKRFTLTMDPIIIALLKRI